MTKSAKTTMPQDLDLPARYEEHTFIPDEKGFQKLAELREKKMAAGHATIYSTLVACMGNHWKPGCREAVWAMCEEAAFRGVLNTFWECPDLCYQPFDGIGTMRNQSYMKAINEGYEYVCYVDNDIRPEPSTLYSLLMTHLPIVAPVIRFVDGAVYKTIPQANPERVPPNSGQYAVSSVLLSMVLFRTAVFIPWAVVPFWENAMGAAEPYHFQRLFTAGHMPFVESSVQLTVVDPPHFPLDNKPSQGDGKVNLWRP